MTPVGVSLPLPEIVTIVDFPFRVVRTRSMDVAIAPGTAASSATPAGPAVLTGASGFPAVRTGLIAASRDAGTTGGVAGATGAAAAADAGAGVEGPARAESRGRSTPP